MKITLKNNRPNTLRIPDLALEIQSGESVELSSYLTKDLLASVDLPVIMNDELIEVKMTEKPIDYVTMKTSLEGLTREEHETLDTLKHNVSENYFFETIKENGQTKYIVYYTDSSKVLKIREEEIIRGETGTVSQIILRNFDDYGNLISTEIQLLNRNATGKVENITVETI